MQYSNNDDGRAFVYYPNNTTMNRHVTSMEKEDEEEMLAAVTRSNRYRTFMENFNDSAAVVVDDVNDDANIISLAVETQPVSSNSNTTTILEESIINPAHPHIWINVKTFAEGIGGWSTTLLELIRLANTTTTTMGISIVEPCMLHGRLGMCVDNNDSSSSSIPVSEIFDLKEVLVVERSSGRLHPIMIPHQEYNIMNTSTSILRYNICMSRFKGNETNPIPMKRCPTSTSLPRDVDLSKLLLLSQQRQASSDGNISSSGSSNNIILNLEDYWMNDSKLGKLIGIIDKRTTTNKELLPPRQLSFHPNHIQTVERILNRVNITGNNAFSVIHWRAEKVGMNYIDCAKAVLNAKIRMMEEEQQQQQQEEGGDGGEDGEVQKQQHSFILLTSLNHNASKMWTGSRNAVQKTDTVKQALDMLLSDKQFISFDNLLSQEMEDSSSSNSRQEEETNVQQQQQQQQQQRYYHDSGMLAIYDLILAIKSKTFASCARDESYGCDEVATRVCDMCNHIGKFGKLAISLRRKFNPITSNDTSYGCWPQPKEDGLKMMTRKRDGE